MIAPESKAPELLPYGSECLLLRTHLGRSVASARRMAAVAEALAQHSSVRETVPGWDEVACFLVPQQGVDDAGLQHELLQLVRSQWQQECSASRPRQHRIPVRYNGPDLQAVAQALDMSAREVIAAHQAQAVTVGVVGFRPHFAYCLGLPAALHLVRKAQPSMVQAGAVAVVEDMSAIYPDAGPGGWHVLGHTDPAYCQALRVGDEVSFIEQNHA